MTRNKQFTTINNLVYMTKTILKKDKILFLYVFLGALSSIGADLAVLFVPKIVIDGITQHTSWSTLVIHVITISGLILVFRVIESTFSRHRSYRFDLVRMDLILEKAMKTSTMPYAALEDSAILDQAQLAHNALENYEGVLGMMVRVYYVFIDLVKMGVTVVLLIPINKGLIGLVVVLAFIHFYFFNRNIEKDKQNTWNKLGPLFRKIGYLNDVTSDFTPAKDIRLQPMAPLLSKKQEEVHKEAHHYVYLSKLRWAIFGSFTNLINGLMELGMYLILAYEYKAGRITIADLTLYLGVVYAFFSTLSGFLYGIANTRRCSLYTNDYRNFMALRFSEPESTRQIKEVKTMRFEFEDVSFHYPNHTNDVLSHFSLVIEEGTKLAIVGMNGAGKSTIIKLLLRLIEPSSGRILLDGIDIKTFNRAHYQNMFAALFQDVHIFALPVSQNVSMKTKEEFDRKKIEESLVLAGLDVKIRAQDSGIDAEMMKIFDEQGIELSGGEKQKLALARAIYKDAPVIVLDEPTSALDALAENQLYKDFNNIIKDKTAIYISHRLASTRFCDAIALVKDGELVEYGSHEDLLFANGHYRNLFELQAKYYLEDAKLEI